ncbi:MAG: succinylglutamate desuccinylase/aspartoacylase family protein [Eubacterium sp.]|nr:succinylglutamate desuccinylase/aspartoacylase family protein [Eubacterium sp.]
MNKKIIYEIKGMYRDDFRITGYEFGSGEETVCIIGNSRGNEVQQIYCCSQLIKKMKQLEEEGRINPGHKILIIPSINPYSVNIQKRFWPTDNTDINRMFPGYNLGETTQRIADGVFKKIMNYKYGIQFTSFYMPGDFVPHVRYMKEGYTTREEALKFGLEYVVERSARPYETATLNYNWQVWNTQAFSLYTDSTEKISNTGAGRAVLSVMNFMAMNDIIKYSVVNDKKSRVIDDSELISVRTAKSGFFEALVNVGEKVEAGKPLANIINSYEGNIVETLYAPISGTIFFIHNAPLTYANTAVIKILGK